MRVLARGWVFEDGRIFGPQDEAVVVGLVVQQPANACIVSGAPEEEEDCKNGYAGVRGQCIESEHQAGEDG